MADPASQTFNYGEKKINVRTMKSDISAFLKETKPSLVQLLATQVESERAATEDRSPHRLQSAIIILISLAFLAGIGILVWQKFLFPSQNQNSSLAIPQPFFSVETSATIEHRAGSLPAQAGQPSLTETIKAAALITEKVGTMKRILVLDAKKDSRETLGANDLLREAGIIMPKETTLALSGPVMLVSHRTPHGMRLAVVVKTSDVRRVFEGVLRSERTILPDWRGLFLNPPPEAKTSTFEDHDYRNLNYRSLTLDTGSDLTLIYGMFPAKEYLVIATSKETFQEIINRLFEDD